MRIVPFVTLVCALNMVPVVASGQAVAVSNNMDPIQVMSQAEKDKLSPVEKEVLATDQEWATAYRTCDMKVMDRILHEKIMFIHGHARVDTKPLLMKSFACSTPRVQAIIQPLRVVMTSPETAITESAMELGSPAQPIKSLITRVYVREGGFWRLIAHQTTRNPGLDESGKPLPESTLLTGPAPATPAAR